MDKSEHSGLVRDGVPIVSFEAKQGFYDWLEANHQQHDAVWLRMYKKASGVPTINWEEAVEMALCFGWIDSLKNSYDEVSFIQKFTPRRKRSIWSKKNCQTCERLTTKGLMRPAGLAQIEAAKTDGRWEAAYDSPKNMTVPEDFVAALEKYPEASTI
jgi:uncharacterized protein YdeI (YjbR/CyaY-like superfamily)